MVKSADGRVIVKTSENLEKEALTKVVNTVASQPSPKTPQSTPKTPQSTPKTQSPKTVIVSTVKSATSTVREVEEKKETSSSKKEEMTPAKAPTKEHKKVSTYILLPFVTHLD